MPPPLPPPPLPPPLPPPQYQQEILVLQERLRGTSQRLEDYETRLAVQDEQNQRMLQEYQARLEDTEERLRRTQDDKDLQMKSIISRWVRGEGPSLETSAPAVARACSASLACCFLL